MEMNAFLNELDREWQVLHSTLVRKNADYATTTDVFANFNKVAVMTNQSVRQVFLIMLGIKLARLSELASGKEAKNEPMADSLLDLIGYAMLWKIWEKE